jgi:hypothetical protein
MQEREQTGTQFASPVLADMQPTCVGKRLNNPVTGGWGDGKSPGQRGRSRLDLTIGQRIEHLDGFLQDRNLVGRFHFNTECVHSIQNLHTPCQRHSCLLIGGGRQAKPIGMTAFLASGATPNFLLEK